MIIAVDGPAGAGKGTICSILAHKLNLTNYCSGEIYRMCAYILTHPELGIWITNPIQIIEPVEMGKIKYIWNKETNTSEVWLGSLNIKPLLHQNNISKQTSLIASQYPEEITTIVQLIGGKIKGDIICEGRNVATHLFPEANYKFYVDADPTVRAQRRLRDLKNKGDSEITQSQVLTEILERDRNDMKRDYAPLIRVPEATLIDTSNQTIDQSVNQIINFINNNPI